MHYSLRFRRTPLRAEWANTSDSTTADGQVDEQTIGARLRMQFGARYNPRWLSRSLDCSEATAKELAGCWMPNGSPGWNEFALAAVARGLEIRPRALVGLIYPPERQTASEVPAATGKHQSRDGESKGLSERRLNVVSIGSNEGVRVIRRRDPRVVWKRPRQFCDRSALAQAQDA